MKKIFILFFATIILCSCSKHISDEPKQLGFEDSGKEISIFTGQSIDINLVENTAAGNVWGISPYKADTLGFISSKFIPDENIKGAGGHRIIRFRALRSGEAVIKITYYKIQENEDKPIKEFRIKVKILDD
ncbi:MAG: protease inhibitor I42 family protein [Victivallales bacterium]|nr:protease inhibitor I42 family protein [Victivallales bacterium]MCF7889274.1 protease inhibitor I42 family protein [Victivallales bacterium]